MSAFGDRRAVNLGAEAIDRYVQQCLDEGKAPATINRGMQLPAQAFRLAIERKRLSDAPKIRWLSEFNARQGFFERAEFDALVKHLPEEIADFARFGYRTVVPFQKASGGQSR